MIGFPLPSCDPSNPPPASQNTFSLMGATLPSLCRSKNKAPGSEKREVLGISCSLEVNRPATLAETFLTRLILASTRSCAPVHRPAHYPLPQLSHPSSLPRVSPGGKLPRDESVSAQASSRPFDGHDPVWTRPPIAKDVKISTSEVVDILTRRARVACSVASLLFPPSSISIFRLSLPAGHLGPLGRLPVHAPPGRRRESLCLRLRHVVHAGMPPPRLHVVIGHVLLWAPNESRERKEKGTQDNMTRVVGS